MSDEMVQEKMETVAHAPENGLGEAHSGSLASVESVSPSVSADATAEEMTETSSVVAVPEKMPLVFTLREENGEPALYLNDKRTDEDAVRDLLQNLSVPVDEQASSLSADKGIAYGEVVRIVDLLKSLGVTKLSLDTRHVDHK